jgi:sulfatase maturation enzyme AslB (radical SAM superfamily)
MKRERKIPPQLRKLLARHNIQPSDIVLYITSHCNLRCKHCYIGNELLSENWYFNLRDCVNFLNDFDHLDRLTILGGEPLLYEGFDKLLNSLHPETIKDFRITTNLTDCDILEKIDPDKLKKTTICVSLDGHTDEIHDYIRGKGSFKKTVTNLNKIIFKGINVEITHTLMQINIDYFSNFISFCKSLGIKNLNLHRMSLQGNALVNKELVVEASTYVAFCNRMEKMAIKDGSLKIRYPIQFATQSNYKMLVEKGLYNPHSKKSYYGDKQRIVLYSNGQVFISSEFFGTESFIGSFDDSTFILNSSPKNELFYFENSEAEISDLNPTQKGDNNFPKVLSVSYKKIIKV